ncbi:hypothetical protein WME97_08265 [Sorangium sp. So ce367]|uniref:hypothetical protein n=1 Tax=Sorangium sp. So ce367 TaxID=3133305 RepID=UPI003F613523
MTSTAGASLEIDFTHGCPPQSWLVWMAFSAVQAPSQPPGAAKVVSTLPGSPEHVVEACADQSSGSWHEAVDASGGSHRQAAQASGAGARSANPL